MTIYPSHDGNYPLKISSKERKKVKQMSKTDLLEYFHELISDIDNGMDNDPAHLNLVKAEILLRMK